MSGKSPRTPVKTPAKPASSVGAPSRTDEGNLLPFPQSNRRRDRNHRRASLLQPGQILLFTGVQIVRQDEDQGDDDGTPSETSVGR